MIVFLIDPGTDAQGKKPIEEAKEMELQRRKITVDDDAAEKVNIAV